QNIVLGGTQDNGSIETFSAQFEAQWTPINGGDGGFNAIDKNSPDTIWYTSNTDVSIQRSINGASSNANDFACDITNASVQGCSTNFPDRGAFYTPYVLDPANNNKIIIGTCRVWRGNADKASGGWGATSF